MALKTFFIHTIGCQMNIHDAEIMALELTALGYAPALSSEEAYLVVVNTCSVRDKAEQKAFSLIGRLESIRQKRPGMIVAVAGCVAQQEGGRIFARAPRVDIVLGTGAIQRLGRAVHRVETGLGPVVDLEPAPAGRNEAGPAAVRRPGKVARFVTIMRGCDNFCAYCVVPFVRGREASRPPESIHQEVEALVACGVREVTLLGQNVNSYGKKEGFCTFAELLSSLNRIDGLMRIRFTTSHPKDLTLELMQGFAQIEKLCPHIHLPVQSGSDRILERMNRGYTRSLYLEKVGQLRSFRPDIAITSDMIVGFPGETEQDFEDTLELIRRVEFDGLFAFIYSDRPNAPAREFTAKVPEPAQRVRLQRLLALQEKYTLAKNQALVGSVQEVLAEGFSKKKSPAPGPAQWSGRTSGNKIVNFNPNGARPPVAGHLVRLRIERALAHSLWGSPERSSSAG
jgi:tRNA-2-methylthio-N6-dimethylallyladenosine synthase